MTVGLRISWPHKVRKSENNPLLISPLRYYSPRSVCSDLLMELQAKVKPQDFFVTVVILSVSLSFIVTFNNSSASASHYRENLLSTKY